MFGKIIDEKLIIAGSSITNKNGGTTTNPTNEQLVANGYKLLVYTEKPTYDKEKMKLVEVYNECEDKIIVAYGTQQLTDEEQFEIKKQKVVELEEEYNMCRWQRELILAQNSGASDYTKTKAQEIESLAKELR